MERLDRLGHASSKADEGPRESADAHRLGRDPVVRAGGRPAPAPLRVNVFVTGGSRGIGRAIALRFARDGAKRVAIGYLRNDRAAEETAEELRALGAEPTLVRGNVTSDRVLERGRRARAARRARAQRGDRRDPARARDRGQALGLDDERERARAAAARPGGGAADAGRLVDRRDLVARRAARARELRRSSARRRRRSRRSSATSPSSSRPRDPRQRRLGRRRRDRRARALPEPRGDARRRRGEPGRPARRAGRHRRRGRVPLLARRRR